MREYAKNHVASTCYLGGFADEVDQVEVVTLESRRPVRRSKPENVGHRYKFWGQDAAVRREAERMLGEIENNARDALRELPVDWPPSDTIAGRAVMMQFLAIHLLRTPGWKRLLVQLAERWIAEHGDSYDGEMSREEMLDTARSDEWIVETLVSEIPVLASMLGSMHWTLVRFPEPCLATSDQPLVAVPFTPGGVEEVSPLPSAGLLHTSEFRIAIDPKHLLLLTWLDRGDLTPPVLGSRSIAEVANIGVRAQADRQWFRRPGTDTPFGAVLLGRASPPAPVGPMLLPFYSPQHAARSHRRRVAERHIYELIESGTTNELRSVMVRRRRESAALAEAA